MLSIHTVIGDPGARLEQRHLPVVAHHLVEVEPERGEHRFGDRPNLPVQIVFLVQTLPAVRLLLPIAGALAIGPAVPPSDLASLAEVPYIAFAGLAVGLVGGTFILLVETFSKLPRWPFWVQATAAGAITSALALAAPEILGIGYHTVDATLLGELAWGALVVILIAKIIATAAACVGVGLPVGIIGRTLVMGGMLGHRPPRPCGNRPASAACHPRPRCWS